MFFRKVPNENLKIFKKFKYIKIVDSFPKNKRQDAFYYFCETYLEFLYFII